MKISQIMLTIALTLEVFACYALFAAQEPARRKLAKKQSYAKRRFEEVGLTEGEKQALSLEKRKTKLREDRKKQTAHRRKGELAKPRARIMSDFAQAAEAEYGYVEPQLRDKLIELLTKERAISPEKFVELLNYFIAYATDLNIKEYSNRRSSNLYKLITQVKTMRDEVNAFTNQFDPGSEIAIRTQEVRPDTKPDKQSRFYEIGGKLYAVSVFVGQAAFKGYAVSTLGGSIGAQFAVNFGLEAGKEFYNLYRQSQRAEQPHGTVTPDFDALVASRIGWYGRISVKDIRGIYQELIAQLQSVSNQSAENFVNMLDTFITHLNNLRAEHNLSFNSNLGKLQKKITEMRDNIVQEVEQLPAGARATIEFATTNAIPSVQQQPDVKIGFWDYAAVLPRAAGKAAINTVLGVAIRWVGSQVTSYVGGWAQEAPKTFEGKMPQSTAGPLVPYQPPYTPPQPQSGLYDQPLLPAPPPLQSGLYDQSLLPAPPTYEGPEVPRGFYPQPGEGFMQSTQPYTLPQQQGSWYRGSYLEGPINEFQWAVKGLKSKLFGPEIKN